MFSSLFQHLHVFFLLTVTTMTTPYCFISTKQPFFWHYPNLAKRINSNRPYASVEFTWKCQWPLAYLNKVNSSAKYLLGVCVYIYLTVMYMRACLFLRHIFHHQIGLFPRSICENVMFLLILTLVYSYICHYLKHLF